MEKLKFKTKLIAPCGMNCGICRAHLRPKDPCPGCRFRGEKPKTRSRCRIKLCGKRNGRFCCDCRDFPCALLKRLDERYRRRYGMSEIDNLVSIREKGVKRFAEEEGRKWISRRGILCVQDRRYYKPRGSGPI